LLNVAGDPISDAAEGDTCFTETAWVTVSSKP